MDDLLPNALDFVSPQMIKLRRWLVLARSPLWIAPLPQLHRPFSEGEPGGRDAKGPRQRLQGVDRGHRRARNRHGDPFSSPSSPGYLAQRDSPLSPRCLQARPNPLAARRSSRRFPATL